MALTDKQKTYIRQSAAKGAAISTIAARVGLTPDAIRKHLKARGIPLPARGRTAKWPDAQEGILRDKWGRVPTAVIAKELKRTIAAVQQKAYKLDLTRPDPSANKNRKPVAGAGPVLASKYSVQSPSQEQRIVVGGKIPCICCRRSFYSPDRVRVRLCQSCKNSEAAGGYADLPIAV